MLKSLKFAALVSLCCVSCSSYSVGFVANDPLDVQAAVPPEHGLVCVVRTSLVGAALTLPIRDNGKLVGATEGPSHFCYRAGVGRHRLTVEVSDADAIELAVSGGDRHFVEHAVRFGSDELLVLNAEQGLAAVTKSEPTVIEGGPEGEPLPGEVPFAEALAD
jgi:hypothetical protein